MSTESAKGELKFIVEPLGHQNRADFRSGDDALDSYLLERAARDVREKIAAVFVLLTQDDRGEILGSYTLSNQEIDAGDLPLALTRKTGKYRRLPATLLGRLAVAEKLRGLRLGEHLLVEHLLGEHLLVDALRRALGATTYVMSFAVVVDAKSDLVVGFYEKYGFVRLSGNRLFLPMKTIEKTFRT